MKHFDSKILRNFLPENSRWHLTRSRSLEAVLIRIAMSLAISLSLSFQAPASAFDETLQEASHLYFETATNFEGGEGIQQAIHADINSIDLQGNPENIFFDAENPQVFGSPDLIVSISKIRTKEKNGGVQLEFQIEVKNIGDGITGERVAILAAISSQDLPPMVIRGLQAGASFQFKYKRNFKRALAGRTILLTVDSENDIPEIDEDNNQTLSMIP